MKKEYQVGHMSASQVESGQLSKWLVDRSNTGWVLKSIERYFSKQLEEDSFLWILEREVPNTP
jgi:hypothetical protein